MTSLPAPHPPTPSPRQQQFTRANKEEALAHLQKNYLKPGSGLFFSGLNNIYRYFNGALTLKDIKAFLRGTYAYTKMREVHKPFRRNPVYCHEKRQLMEIDLIQLTPDVARANRNKMYILVAIDVFSRKVWAQMVTTKAARDIVPTFDAMLTQHIAADAKMPDKILADQGMEWRSQAFKNLMQKYNIVLFHNYSSYHGAHVERVNRTLQRKLMGLATAQGSYDFHDQLQAVVASYNASFHRSINMAPQDADRDVNRYQVRLFQAKKYSKFSRKKQPQFRLHQICRISFDKTKFSRSYNPTFSDTLYRITGINQKLPEVMYSLARVGDDEPLLGKFYAAELQPVSSQDYFPIDKIVKVFPKRKTCLVRWSGYDASFDSELPLSEVKSYKDLLREATSMTTTTTTTTPPKAAVSKDVEDDAHKGNDTPAEHQQQGAAAADDNSEEGVVA